jgi:glycolate oxidase FAD binding subunit
MALPPQVAMKEASQELWKDIAGALGAEHVRDASAADTVAGVQPEKVVEPVSAEELARVLRMANAAGIAVVPRGGGTKIGWGNPPTRADLVLSTARLNRVLEHAWADMTAIVEAGCTVAQVQSTLARHGQRLAIDPLWPERATIGGMLATNDSGSLRVRYGSLRDLIIGITVALPDGTLAKSGGKVVKNVAGYDLPKLVTGSLGTLGVVTQAIFRLHPLPKNSRTMTFEPATAEALNQILLAILDSQMAFTGLQFRASQQGKPQLDVRFDGTPTGIDAQVEQARKLAAAAREVDSPSDAWHSAESLWAGCEAAVIAKISVLPAHFEKVCALVAATGLRWSVVAQGIGVGWLRLDGADTALGAAVQAIRKQLADAEGSVITYGCPPALKNRLDTWGVTGDEHALMLRVKRQFDPAGTLNPGRFVGGI